MYYVVCDRGDERFVMVMSTICLRFERCVRRDEKRTAGLWTSNMTQLPAATHSQFRLPLLDTFSSTYRYDISKHI